MYREDDKEDKFIKIKVESIGTFFIFLSHQENVVKNSNMLEYSQSKIVLGHFTSKKGKLTYAKDEDIEWGREGKEHGLWLVVQQDYVHAGSWNNDNGFSSIAIFKISDVSTMRFLGFSSIEKSNWIVSNGECGTPSVTQDVRPLVRK